MSYFVQDHLRKRYLPCLPIAHGNDLKELLKDCFRLGLIAKKKNSEGHLCTLCCRDDFILCRWFVRALGGALVPKSHLVISSDSDLQNSESVSDRRSTAFLLTKLLPLLL